MFKPIVLFFLILPNILSLSAEVKKISSASGSSLCMSAYNMAISKDFAVGGCMSEVITDKDVSDVNKNSPVFCENVKAACLNNRPKYTKAFSKKFSCTSNVINYFSKAAKNCNLPISTYRTCISDFKSNVAYPAATVNFCAMPSNILSLQKGISKARNAVACQALKGPCAQIYKALF